MISPDRGIEQKIVTRPELYIVVNDDNRVLDLLPKKIAHAAKLRDRTVSAVLFHPEDNSILLQRRSLTRDVSPGLWTLSATGHVGVYDSDELRVEPAEMNARAIRREIFEELGVIPQRLRYLDTYRINGAEHRSITALFVGQYNGDVTVDPGEVSEARFFGRDDIVNLQDQLTFGTKTVLSKLGVLR